MRKDFAMIVEYEIFFKAGHLFERMLDELARTVGVSSESSEHYKVDRDNTTITSSDGDVIALVKDRLTEWQIMGEVTFSEVSRTPNLDKSVLHSEEITLLSDFLKWLGKQGIDDENLSSTVKHAPLVLVSAYFDIDMVAAVREGAIIVGEIDLLRREMRVPSISITEAVGGDDHAG